MPQCLYSGKGVSVPNWLNPEEIEMKAKMSNLVNGAALNLLVGAITVINPSLAYAINTKNCPG